MESDYSNAYFEVENKHWWFVARRKILKKLILSELKKLGKNKFDRSLEIGCFAGKNLESFKDLSAAWSGIEPSEEAGKYAQNIFPAANIIIGKFPDVSFDQKFDAIFLFDVLEHIKDSSVALQEIEQMLNPGGLLIVTVPAYQWMWTRFDDLNQHYRRYTSSLLLEQLQSAKLVNIRIGYFNTLLFLPAVLERLVSKMRGEDDAQMNKVAVPVAIVNALLRWIFSLESYVLPKSFFPFGVSVISVSYREKSH